MRDVNTQVLPMFLRFRAPNFAQYVAVRKDAARMPDKQAEQGVLGGGQLDFTARPRYHTRRKIHNEITVLENDDTRFGVKLIEVLGTKKA